MDADKAEAGTVGIPDAEKDPVGVTGLFDVTGMRGVPGGTWPYGAEDLGDVCVLGLGRTGLVASSYLADLIGSRVRSVTLYGGKTSRASDETRALERRGVRVVLGTEDVEGSFDLAVVSPGIPEGSDFFMAARHCSRELIGEPELAWRESPERWIGITGTNGKTTTTLLTTELLRTGGLEVEAVGNVGTVATGEVARRVFGSWFVAELSSFQLATSAGMHPRVGCLLNVTPDHLEWHGSMESYAACKERMFARMGPKDLAIISQDDEWCRAIAMRLEERGLRVCRVSVHAEPLSLNAAYVSEAGRLVVRLDGVEQVLIDAKSMALQGQHNVQNALVAAAAALEVGVSRDAVRHCLLLFEPLEHRIEPCGMASGVRYVNDSKATNVDAVEKALTAFVPGHVVVMLGGHDKGTELSSLAHVVSARCKAAVCYGDAGPRIAEALRVADGDMGLVVVEVPHMAEALEAAKAIAETGDVVLLSPACSSFDEFGSYTERGTRFKELVAKIVAEDPTGVEGTGRLVTVGDATGPLGTTSNLGATTILGAARRTARAASATGSLAGDSGSLASSVTTSRDASDSVVTEMDDEEADAFVAAWWTSPSDDSREDLWP